MRRKKPSLIVRLVMTDRMGAEFTSRTTTVTRLVALKEGTPLSATTTEKALVLGPVASEVGQVILPEELIERPAGAPARVYARVWPGSVSVAPRLSERVVLSSIVMLVAA